MRPRIGLHDLAIEDALRAHQRPKLGIYGELLFIERPRCIRILIRDFHIAAAVTQWPGAPLGRC